MSQNYGKAETNNKVMQLSALWRKKKVLHYLGKLKLEIITEFLDDFMVFQG